MPKAQALYLINQRDYNRLKEKIASGETLTEGKMELYIALKDYLKAFLKNDILPYIQPCVIVDNSLLLTIDNNRSWIKEGNNWREIIIIK